MARPNFFTCAIARRTNLYTACLFLLILPFSLFAYPDKVFYGVVSGQSERALCSPRMEVHWSAGGILAIPKKLDVEISPQGVFNFRMPTEDSVYVYVFDDCHYVELRILTNDSSSSQSITLKPLPELRIRCLDGSATVQSFEAEMWQKHNPLWPEAEEFMTDAGIKISDPLTGEAAYYDMPFIYRVKVFELADGTRTGRWGEALIDLGEDDMMLTIPIKGGVADVQP